MSAHARTQHVPYKGQDAGEERLYDIFEVLADGSPRWRGTVEGAENIVPRLIELAGDTKKQLFAYSAATSEVVARINASGRSSRRM